MFYVLLVFCTLNIQGIVLAAPADISPEGGLPVPLMDDVSRVKLAAPADEGQDQSDLPAAPAIVDVASQPELTSQTDAPALFQTTYPPVVTAPASPVPQHDALRVKAATVLAAATTDEDLDQPELPAAPAIIVDVASQPELTDASTLFQTNYQCGSTLYGSEVLITGGKLARRGEVPWHAGIYRKTSRTYAQICGGTLISNNIIISAAHCFWNGEEEQPPPERFAVAVGKLNQRWQSDIAEIEEQKSYVKEIYVPDNYQASDANYQEDIAVVKVTSPFQYTSYVRPVCVDFRTQLERKQLQVGNYGKVAGWGLTTEDGGSSEFLKLIKLPYVATRTCIMKSPFTFRAHITGDKFCAGYKNSNQAVCLGDSGGGLVFPFTERGITRYYLRGIVSVAPDSDRQCNVKDIATFTRLLKHEDFIRQFWDYEQSPATTCAPVPLTLTTLKTGQKAWDKCIEYQEKLVFPCSERANGDYVRTNRCHHNASGGFTDGNEVQRNEFPHMALLVHGKNITNRNWICVGALISEHFVLMPGLGIKADDETPYYVILGDINELNDKTSFKVKQVHIHPKEKHINPLFYGIILVELEKSVILNEFLVPACLHTGDNIDADLAVIAKWDDAKPSYEMKKRQHLQAIAQPYDSDAIAIQLRLGARISRLPNLTLTTVQSQKHRSSVAFGLLPFSSETAATLALMLLTKSSAEDCRINTYWYSTNDHVCYISTGSPYGKFVGHEGSPLQTTTKKIGCMYTIIGVIPFRIIFTAANIHIPFTAIAPYVEWIEKIVWP